jgi:hypothetical protein
MDGVAAHFAGVVFFDPSLEAGVLRLAFSNA